MTLLFTTVTCNVALVARSIAAVIHVCECNPVCSWGAPAIALLLPVGEQVVRFGDGGRVMVSSLEVVVFKVFD